MTPARPLSVPTPSDIRCIFDEPRQPPKVLRDFMRAAAPMIKDDFITEIAASVVASIAASSPGMRIKRLYKLTSQVNFTPELAREVTRTADRLNAPREYVEAAERMVPPLENLAGGLRETGPPFPSFKFEEPMSPEQEGAYRESMTSLGEGPQGIGSSRVLLADSGFGVAPVSSRGQYRALYQVHHRRDRALRRCRQHLRRHAP